ncbi:hypothetical protein [Kribbella speibonae]|uniref:hypothetical protein n=1 Tax=Kribbella speibonae TaxID=1572660 RepID=UPI00192D8E89|nr:hypothetical protein [Kribbella speibonae]
MVANVEPGSTHDLTAAREHVLGALHWAASRLDLPRLADGGYDGAGIGMHTPDQTTHRRTETPRRQPHLQRTAARATRPRRTRLRRAHRALAHPEPHHRQTPKIGKTVKAALVLTQIEHGHLT